MAAWVIINVDDLGLHVAVRRAVEELAAAGVVTSASLLANGPDLDNALRIGSISLGAHLNILRGEPISPAGEVQSLLGSDGRFLGSYSALLRRYVTRRLDLGEVELEWSRQVERLLALGARLVHVDGEKHTHAWPRLFPIAERVAAAYRIPFVRIPRERWRGGASLAGQARVAALAWWLRGVRRRQVVDEVWGIANQAEALTAAGCVQALGRADDGSITRRAVEVVCHPGVARADDGEIDSAFGRMRVRDLWQPEFASLHSGGWRDALAQHGWRLASFDDLPR